MYNGVELDTPFIREEFYYVPEEEMSKEEIKMLFYKVYNCYEDEQSVKYGTYDSVEEYLYATKKEENEEQLFFDASECEYCEMCSLLVRRKDDKVIAIFGVDGDYGSAYLNEALRD